VEPAPVAAVPPATAAATYAAVDEIVTDEPPPEDDRPSWGWALAIGTLVVAAIIAALFLTGTIGGKKVAVPKVVGIDQAAAATVLHREDLEVSFDAVASNKRKGIVISQDPSAGTKVKEGTTVHALVSSGPGDRQVPSVDDLTEKAAKEKLTKAGFKVTVHRRDDADVAKGHVIETQPAGGTTLPVGSEVALYISNGPPDVEVPQVTGQTLDEARGTLEEDGFKVQTQDQETEDEEPGTVLAQSPAAGGVVPQGSTVTLTVAKEPSEVEVPDVTGQTDTEAINGLQDAGFKISVEREDVETPDEDGIVLQQDPEGAEKAKPGSVVTIVVGRFNPDLNPEGTDTTPTTPDGTSTTGTER
jgi:serine/threonine-protein kinase